jgi:hypothetical protein
MKKKDLRFLLILIICILLVPIVVHADAVASCNTLLGNPKNPDEPAYYVNMAFQLIKYVCMVLLLIYSTIDFAKALTTEDQAALKNAGLKSGKRVIYLIVLFFLPTLIFTIFEWLGIVSASDCSPMLSGN